MHAFVIMSVNLLIRDCPQPEKTEKPIPLRLKTFKAPKGINVSKQTS